MSGIGNYPLILSSSKDQPELVEGGGVKMPVFRPSSVRLPSVFQEGVGPTESLPPPFGGFSPGRFPARYPRAAPSTQ